MVTSPITAELLIEGAVGIAEVVTDGNDVFWAESRPNEGGRVAVMVWRQIESGGAEVVEVTNAAVNVRTRVHEYGGGAWWVADGRLVYSDDARNGELFVLHIASGHEVQLTSSGYRYADGRLSPDGEWFVAVRERHDGAPGDEVRNEVVAVSTDGQGTELVLLAAHDFYAAPRFGLGGQLVCVAWNHPDMPWDSTELQIIEPDWLDGNPEPTAKRLGSAGDAPQSIVLPDWTDDGRLLAVSDRSNWWNLVEIDVSSGVVTPVVEGEFEIATPGWVFGLSRWCEAEGGIVVVAGTPTGDTIGFPNGYVEDQHTSVGSIRPLADGRVAYVGASYAEEPAVWVHDGVAPLRVSSPRELGLDASLFPEPELIAVECSAIDRSLPTGTTTHSLFYEPALAGGGEIEGLPPLLVLVHGGPTAAARRQLDLSIRYWTSRGIAVAAVDYRGSTLYGRAYRNELRGAWGVADVLDCVAVAQHLSDAGRVDPDSMIIQGGSAGGLTVLNAVAKHRVFSGGISRYGVTDLRSLATDTHKFEARYLDRLVGLWPQDEQIYLDRSPVSYPDQITVPMLILQGEEDKVVPPSQAAMIVDALRASGVPVTYHLFAGEGHGFRDAATIVAVLRATEEFIRTL